jgi:hypothetical protein
MRRVLPGRIETTTEGKARVVARGREVIARCQRRGEGKCRHLVLLLFGLVLIASIGCGLHEEPVEAAHRLGCAGARTTGCAARGWMG